MEIYIMRHGEPALPELPAKITSHEFLQGLELYKRCGILRTSKPETDKLEKFSQFPVIVSSDLKRSLESAMLFTQPDQIIIDPLFREIDDDFFLIPWLKLAPRTWSTIFILMWYFGAFRFKKSFSNGRRDANNCAQILTKLAKKHGRVLLVGHGFMNTYIAKALIASGWSGPKLPGKSYWGYGVYLKSDNN